MRKAFATTMVVLLALSAGCLGFFGGQDTTDTTPTAEVTEDTEEMTETSTSTETSNDNESNDESLSLDSLPEGVTSSEVQEQTVLNGHLSTVSDSSSATVSYESTIDDGEYTVTDKITTKFDSSARQITLANDRMSRSMYTKVDGDMPVYVRTASDSEDRYIINKELDIPQTQVTQQMRVRALVLGAEYQYKTNATVDGEPVAVLEATEIRDSEELIPIAYGEADSINATAYVTSDGVVKKIDFEITATDRSGNEIQISGTLSNSDVGETTVDKPDWFSTAKDDGVTMNIQKQDKFVTAEMNRGETIPAGTTVRIFLENGKFAEATLEKSVEPGDTVYIGIADGSAVVGVNEKPSSTSTFSDSGDVTFATGNAVAYQGQFGNDSE